MQDSSSSHEVLACPKCSEATMASETHLGVEIDRCPQCQGIFFDRGELERLLEAHGGAGIDGLSLSDPDPSQDLTPAKCPRCVVPMTASEGPAKGVRIDKCFSCGAVFLDQGELSTIQLWKTLSGS